MALEIIEGGHTDQNTRIEPTLGHKWTRLAQHDAQAACGFHVPEFDPTLHHARPAGETEGDQDCFYCLTGQSRPVAA